MSMKVTRPTEKEHVDTFFDSTVSEALEELYKIQPTGDGDLTDEDFKSMKHYGVTPEDLTEEFEQVKYTEYLKNNP